MNEAQLRKHANCNICGQGIGHTGSPLFWTLIIQRHYADPHAADWIDDLNLFMGNGHPITAAMRAEQEVTKPTMEPLELTVCEECAMRNGQPIMVMVELAPKVDEDKS